MVMILHEHQPPCGRGAGLEEDCVKDPKRIKIKQAIAGHTTKLQQTGYKIVCGVNHGEIVKESNSKG